MIKAILFDLDGTLLPMDQDEFTKGYFKLLAAKLAPYGYEPKTLIDTIWAGTAAMVKNTGAQTNEAAFWEMFSRTYGAEKTERDKPLFEEFYGDDFQRASVFCPRNDKAAETGSQSSNGSATASRSPQIRFSRASQPAPASAGQGSRRRISRL